MMAQYGTLCLDDSRYFETLMHQWIGTDKVLKFRAKFLKVTVWHADHPETCTVLVRVERLISRSTQGSTFQIIKPPYEGEV